ncbi:hypothetical protein A9Z62_09190 [Haemophilus haemolyticus]|uniref:Uncharacterized protein n=2 Tax=Haemophilus haemolyticus TaxID=726 RepID=A0A1B8PEW1_HAEHA|nr:hypothetical protein A9Z62_09190 [Haemophilus haemolyticus]
MLEAKSINKKLKSFCVLNMCATHPKDKERAESLELLQQAGLKSTVIDEPIFDRKILRTSFSEGGSCFEVKANKSADEIAVVLQKILGI